MVSSPEDYSIGIGPFGSNLKVSDYKETGVPLIFVKNITANDFKKDLKYISPDKYLTLLPHSVKPLDLVITKMGDPPGDCEIYPQNSEMAVLTADCLKFRIWSKHASRTYFKLCMSANLIKKQLGYITKGVAQKKISTERFKTLLFPLPPKLEQDEIAQNIEVRFSIVDNLYDAIEQSHNKAQILRQSILKQAFEGKLVPQDPDDEPAEKLLERIKAEKEAFLKSQKQQKRKPITKKGKAVEPTQSILEILKASKRQLEAKEVWQKSRHKDDIEAFYAELKSIEDQIKEIKKDKHSLLSLKK